ncbi:MAG: ECF-type sigma factor, partial [Planctomycetota bacterium]
MSQSEPNVNDSSDVHFADVYDELKGLARAHIVRLQPGQTLSATALVHEAFFKLVKPSDQTQWDSRGHFFSSAARAMRQILVDRARRRNSLKRGGDRERLEIDVNEFTHVGAVMDHGRLLDLNDALDELVKDYPIESELVHLRFFAGLSFEDAALALG